MPKRSLSALAETLQLREPFKISNHTFHEAPVVVVTIAEAGVSGRGEASGVFYRNDDVAAMLAAIESVRPDIEAGMSREELQQALPPGGARNALDCALWDLQAKRERRPVWQIAGLPRPQPLLTTVTLSAESPEVMAQSAREHIAFSAIKMKLTGDARLDAERVAAVRAARPEAWLSVDANQGYSAATLREVLPALASERISLIEQPLPRGREADLDGLRIPIPIAADESMLGLDEVPRLVGRFDVMNIKLDKCGGLTEALLMAAEARRLGLRLMVGSMACSSWAMAPAFLLAQLCEFVDLDGPLGLANDRSPGVRYAGGYIHCDDVVWGGIQQDGTKP
jgi:L-alanine-DL-glutamate epimerase-like enolase superfamily enzyme